MTYKVVVRVVYEVVNGQRKRAGYDQTVYVEADNESDARLLAEAQCLPDEVIVKKVSRA